MNEHKKISPVEQLAMRMTSRVGSISSLVVHSLLFIGAFGFILIGYSLEKILLVLTTIVSLEAIYLAIFIQMTVNRNTESLEVVEENIDEIQEDVDEIQKDVDEIQEDVDEIQKDVDEIQEDVDEVAEDVKEDDQESAKTKQAMEKITADLQRLLKDMEALRNTQE